ncbi:Octanoate-[acyl-carrier-protein]-protein-N-octanoyltransferase [hydrothermal vent metagenome]|uniref:lipoyl(octanoyl) transferase n=1 Tax=hydrothermal vent metagenome TaxID=652676 RepID=A0A3B1DXS6_9ZZZZ
MNEDFRPQDLGLIDYREAYDLQKKCVQDVLADGEQRLFLCEHPAILTLGRMADEAHILVPKSQLKKKGVQILSIDRGGDITLHAPGQLVIYPIFNLNYYEKNLHLFIQKLENVAIDLLKEFDIVADRFLGQTGVWVGEKKIVSIGIGVRRWITFHGLAINVNTDLNLFSLIKPCGLDVIMTSMADIKKYKIDMQEVKDKVVVLFKKYFY